MEETLYFAYGSNINLEQMAHRCPDAQIVGPVTLENYELRFRGSGFATVTPKKGSVVHGLLWKLTPESERALDRYEGYPRHYTKEQVSVRTADGAAVSVMAYIMAEPMCRQPALPSPYYYRAIQQGFEANGLSVESLEEAWNRTIDEVWSGKVDRPQKRNMATSPMSRPRGNRQTWQNLWNVPAAPRKLGCRSVEAHCILFLWQGLSCHDLIGVGAWRASG